MELHRRDLVCGLAAVSAASYARVLGANDRIHLGLIGAGDRGRHDMSQFQAAGGVDVAAVCDVYAEQIDKARQKAPNAKNFNDHRKLLELKDVDAVLIATPDHWHAETTIDALNAGKDVYVEKPLTLTIEEGPRIVKAARVNERICQVGMQQRSGQHYLQAKREYFDTGKLGKITLARTWWHGNSYHLRRAPVSLQSRPSNLDWAHFLGPVKWRDYDPQQYFNWRAYLDFGGGQVTDLFTHWIDVVHMFMEGSDIPSSAVAAAASTTTRTAAPRRTPSTCCWSTRRASRRRLRLRWRRGSPERRLRCAARMAACISTADATSTGRRAGTHSRWW
jgi:predicted dehydrogenase